PALQVEHPLRRGPRAAFVERRAEECGDGATDHLQDGAAQTPNQLTRAGQHRVPVNGDDGVMDGDGQIGKTTPALFVAGQELTQMRPDGDAHCLPVDGGYFVADARQETCEVETELRPVDGGDLVDVALDEQVGGVGDLTRRGIGQVAGTGQHLAPLDGGDGRL